MWRRALPAVALLLVVGAILLAVDGDFGSISRTVGRDVRSHAEPPAREEEPRLRGHGVEAAAASGSEARRQDSEAARPEAGGEKDEPIWPSLRVEAMDGLTGRSVSASWNLGTGRVTAGPFPPGAVIDDAAMARVRKGVEESLAHWERGFLDAGVAREEAMRPDEGVLREAYVLRPAPGYVRENPQAKIRGTLAAGVTQTLFVEPVWPEAVLELQVLDPEGDPAEGVELDALMVAGRRRDDLAIESEGLSPGHLRIRGIPRLPGEEVKAVLIWGWDEEQEDEVSVEFAEDESIEDPPLVARIPEDPTLPWRAVIRLEAWRGPFWDFVETDNDLEYEESLGQDDAAEPPHAASLRVRAIGWDGRPIPHARVNGEETNGEGEVLLSALRPGEHTLVMRAPGRFPARRSLVLVEDEQAEMTLTEPGGARLEVLVTDETGRPRPSAQIRVAGRIVFDVRDGVQRLDPFTDAQGRRTLERVEPGRTTVFARWGSRRGKQTVELRDGETTSIHIVAK